MFVLTMNNGKKNGSYIELGCEDRYWLNNTALLEENYGWTGVAIDIRQDKVDEYAKHSKAKVVCGDATKLDYNSILDKEIYDYLQVDCEPATSSFNALKKIDLTKRKFAVITFEHDAYCDVDITVRDKQRKYLESFGYVLVAGNIAHDMFSPFEDWWVHPDLVNKEILDIMMSTRDTIKRADLYMLNKL